MTLDFVTKYLDEKINENENYIVCTVYDLRVRNGVNESEVADFLEMSKIRLENLYYKVYFTGEQYTFHDKNKIVENNEYMVAIKE